MAFQTLDLGRILQQGEAIKGMQRQSVTDQLQQQFLTQRIKAGEEGMAADAATRQQQQTQLSEQQKLENSKWLVGATSQILSIQDPAQQSAIAGKLIDEGKRRGVIPADYQYDGKVDIQALQQLNQEAKMMVGEVPEQQPVQMETVEGPDGALLQRDPVTGALKEVLGRKPRDPAPEKGPTAPAGYRYKADGSLEPIPGGPAAAGPKNANISEGERKAAALGTRLEGSLRELASIPLNEQKPGVMETVAGVAGETAANLARSSDRQRADSAQLDALDAALTLATGAAYTKEQLQNLRKSYFPQLGDSEANRKAKEKRFEMIVKTARIAAGRAEPAINEAQSGATGSWDQPKQIGGFTVRRVK